MLELSSELCTGCGACMNACPKNAIQMSKNNEGFFYPVVGKDCINCNLCNQVCPVYTPKANKKFLSPKCYAAWAKDENIRKASSSGGIFSLLAQYVFVNGGYVCGVKMTAPDTAEHVLVKTEEELKALRRSKYVQAKPGFVYREIKKLLENKKMVLFSGTPCQVAGLNSFLKKDYDNLLTVDMVCHGVPSPLVLEKYISEQGGCPDINFRNQSRGWNNQSISYGDKIIPYRDDDYMRAFLSDLSTGKSCSQCPFAKLAREGDFTLGDFWGIKAYDKNLDDDKGTSLVLLNTRKAENIFNLLELGKKCEIPLTFACKTNRTLLSPYPAHVNRDVFFTYLKTDTLHKALQKSLDVSKNVAVINFWWSLNYGAVLTAYALQEIISQFGYRPVHLQYVIDWARNSYPGSFSQKFAQRYLHISAPLFADTDFAALNASFDTFICGSDQVFNLAYIRADMDKYLLGFTPEQKRRIALAASFGSFEEKKFENFKKMMQAYLSRFSAVSVREEHGKDICNGHLGIKAEAVFDPVFCLDKAKWQALASDSERKFPKHFILVYVLDEKPALEALILRQAEECRAKIVRIDKSFEVSDWLKAFSGACRIITDSFHGVCFSLIFEKEFICIGNKERGLDRFRSLFSSLGISREQVVCEAFEQAPVTAPDYDIVMPKIRKMAGKTVDFLQKTLKAPIPSYQSDDVCRQIKCLKKEERRNKLKYIALKICSKICFGKKRKYFKEQAKICKNIGKYSKKLRKVLKRK